MNYAVTPRSVAVLGGAFAAALLSAIMMFARLMRMPMQLELLIGSFFTGSTGPATWVLGYVIHIAVGASLALVYASLFRRAGSTTLGRGAAYGALHGLLSGTLLAFIPLIHPLVPERIAAPHVLMAHLGAAGVLVFVGLHILYGMIVAGVCANVAVPQVTIHSPR